MNDVSASAIPALKLPLLVPPLDSNCFQSKSHQPIVPWTRSVFSYCLAIFGIEINQSCCSSSTLVRKASLTSTHQVDAFTLIQASDYPPPYPSLSASGDGFDSSGREGGDRKGKGRDDTWQSDRGGGSEERDSGRSAGDGKDRDEDDDGGKQPKKKLSKKTDMACHFCRGRKLKCDGGRPTCLNCARRSLACAYDEHVRRRGPGRKNRKLLMQQQEQEQEYCQQPEASASTTTLTSVYRNPLPPPLYSAPTTLPGPPVPQYNYELGRIQPTNVGPGAGIRSASGDSSTRTQAYYRQDQQYSRSPQYTGQPPHNQATQQQRDEQYYHQQLARNQQYLAQTAQGGFYGQGYAQASTSTYSSHMEGISYRGGLTAEAGETEYPSGDDEGTSGSRSKRRASSPLEDNLADYQRRKYDEYNPGTGT